MPSIDHPTLGLLMADETMRSWTTPPQTIGQFGYMAQVTIWTDNCAPDEKLLEATLALVKSGEAFKNEVAGYMYHAYRSYIREEYVPIIDNPEYQPMLTPEDLPQIIEVSQVWGLITGMNMSYVHWDNFKKYDIPGVSLSFSVRFDPGHEFVVRFENGKLCECMMDG